MSIDILNMRRMHGHGRLRKGKDYEEKEYTIHSSKREMEKL